MVLVALLFVVGLLVRLIGLNAADLWGDELCFIHFGTQPGTAPWKVFLSYYGNPLVHPHLPLPAVIQNLYLHGLALFGIVGVHNAFIQRLPGVLFGVTTVILLYRLAGWVMNRTVALCAGMLFAGMFLPVYYSREVCSYPLLMLFAVWSLERLTMLLQKQLSVGGYLALFIAFTGLTYCHLYGMILLVAIGLVLGTWSVLPLTVIGKDAEPVRGRSRVGLVLGALALLLVMPFVYGIVKEFAGSETPPSGLSYGVMFGDMLGKCLLGGDRAWKLLLAWGLFLAGLWGFSRQGKPRRAMMALLAAQGLALVPVMYLCRGRQYYVRYFSIFYPGVYLVMACGIVQLAAWLEAVCRKRISRNVIAVCLTVLLLAANWMLFIRAQWTLQSRGIDYFGIQTWLSEQVEPGTPVVIESRNGWDTRLFPGMLRPPDRQVFGMFDTNTQARAEQEQLIRMMPSLVWVEPMVHSWGRLPELYQHSVEFTDPALHQLMNRGMGIQDKSPGEDTTARRIWYNTPAEARALSREQGRVLYATYPGFAVGQLGPGTYAWVTEQMPVRIRIENLAEQSVRGAVVVRGAMLSQATVCQAVIEMNGAVEQAELPVGQVWQYAFSAQNIAPAGTVMTWHVSSPNGDPVTMAVFDVRLQPAP